MHRSLIAVALLLLTPMAIAQAYKWTDASGTVHYSESPPAKGTNYKKVTTTGTVEAPVPLATHRESNRESEPEPAKPVADTPENRGKLCETLKTNLTALQGSGPVVMKQGGKDTALDTDQRQQQITTAQSRYDQYCQAR